ncbi:signal recognition particle subunit SRP72-like isoform X1 [Vespula squamosa]|uniref:Signal recognition particle subunit SRP72 n=1 Tax=Vespula squamosa TaxID=30214 RepID=A0ABD2BDN0_VESSQ
MKFIVVFTFALIVGTLGLTDEQKAKLKEYKESCITESGVDPATVENAKNGNIPEGDEKLSCFAACFVKKMGIFSPEGDLNEEILRARLQDSLPEDKVEEVFQKCKTIDGATTCQKGENYIFIFYSIQSYSLQVPRCRICQVDNMTSKESNISALYAELNKLGQNGEYERALKTANRILGITQDEEAAFHCKVICYIQLSKFNEGLQLITKNQKLAINLDFEKAYCLYRLNQVAEALKVVEGIQNPSLKVKELKAQILYRLEKYEECFAIYRDIIKNSDDEYEDERETNLAAVLVNLTIENSSIELPSLQEDTYELTYNAACQLIALGSIGDKSMLVEAEKKLKAAEKMCKEGLEEDGATEEEIENELGIIRVQLGCCLQLLGREKEAQTLYTAALKSKPDDIALVAVASNNLVCLNKDQNVFDSKKRMKSATHESLEHKLTSKQRRTIAYNQCLLTLYTDQGEQCQQLCNKLAKDYPALAADAMFVKAIQLSKDGKAQDAAKLLLEHATAEKELQMKLVAVQLLLSQSERKEAINILENLSESDRSLPGIVSALVTLHMADNNRDSASAALKNAVNYYKKHKATTTNLGELWRQAADFYLRGGEIQVAADILQELVDASPSDTKTLAQLVVAYVQFCPAKAHALYKRLPPLHDLKETTDVDALESSNWVIGTKVVRKKVEPSPGKPVLDQTLRKHKIRKRKGKLPKNFDPNVLPDPERWLPRHERSNFRKKRDRRNRDAAMKGTQGVATGASDLYDITKMPANAKPSPNPRHNTAVEVSGPRQQQRKVQQKKKKKGQNGEYERALKTANRILGITQDEEAVFHCKIICYIQLSKFSEGLQLIIKNQKWAINLDFEKAYCLYRLNQVPEALKVVEGIQNPSLKVKELKAQILYRLEKYEECFAIYRDIIKNSDDEYEDERETNLAAVLVNLTIENSSIELPSLQEDTYELTYNAACQLIALGSIGDKSMLVEAEKKLKAAEKMCKEGLEEDGATEEEIENELGIIRVQLGCCLQLLGREKEAQTLYTAALKSKPDDIALVAVASNNLVCLNKDQNVFDSKKRMKSATHESLEHKLTSKQRKTIAYNQCLLALYTDQGEQCQQLCNKLAKDYPALAADAMFVKAIQLSKDGKAQEAAKLLLEHATAEKELQMKLVAVQLLLSQSERKEAINILENLSESDRSLPGIVSALVTLHMADNNRDSASAALKNAVNYYKKHKATTTNLGELWRQAADFYLRGGEIQVAADILQELVDASPSDTKTLAQLVMAYVQFCPAKAHALYKRLPPLHDLKETTDVDALESSNWVIGTKVVRKKVEPSPGKPVLDQTLRKHKIRKRKGKLPKNFDPNVLPDPERWLPRHERSNFRKKRDRRNRDAAMKGTQGVATGASDLYDITKMPANAKPSPNPRHNTAVEVSGPRQQQRKVQQKKKKKGGKW